VEGKVRRAGGVLPRAITSARVRGGGKHADARNRKREAKRKRLLVDAALDNVGMKDLVSSTGVIR